MKLTTVAREGASVIIAAYLISLCLHAIEQHASQKKTLVVGDRFTAEIARPQASRLLVIAISATCRYSRNSREFHGRLIEAARNKGLAVAVLTEQSSLATSNAGAQSLSGVPVGRADLASLGIDSTPSILLIDRGRVYGRWTGQLSHSQEKVVTSRLDPNLHTFMRLRDDNGSFDEPVTLSQADTSRLLDGARVLDVRERDESDPPRLPNALNIPEDELTFRADIEIPNYESCLVVDCSFLREGKCGGIGRLLFHLGFHNVWVYDRGALGASCASTPVGKGS